MKIISKTLKLLPLFLFVFTFQACSDDDDGGPIAPNPSKHCGNCQCKSKLEQFS